MRRERASGCSTQGMCEETGDYLHRAPVIPARESLCGSGRRRGVLIADESPAPGADACAIGPQVGIPHRERAAHIAIQRVAATMAMPLHDDPAQRGEGAVNQRSP